MQGVKVRLLTHTRSETFVHVFRIVFVDLAFGENLRLHPQSDTLVVLNSPCIFPVLIKQLFILWVFLANSSFRS